MIRMKVLSSPPDTCFVIASDLTAGQSKVGDLFRHSQNVLSVFLAGRRMSTSYCGGPRGARPVPIINVFSLSSFQVLAPIINVFKLDSGQLKWVFVLQA